VNSRRLVTAVTAVALLAAACGTDDTIETADSVTTVPPTASPTTTIPAPDNPDEATTTTPSVGDINQAAVKLDPLVRLVQPIDAVVAPNGEWWIAQRRFKRFDWIRCVDGSALFCCLQPQTSKQIGGAFC